MLIFLDILETEEEKLSFEELYMKHNQSMLGLAWSVLGDESDARDAVSNAFVAAAENYSKLKSLSKAQQHSFLMTLAKYKAIDIYRERKKIVYVDTYPEDIKAEEATDNPKIDALYRAMKKLTPLQRDILVLKLDQELSTKEIAKLTNRKYDAVRKDLQRAVQKLKIIMSEDGYEI